MSQPVHSPVAEVSNEGFFRRLVRVLTVCPLAVTAIALAPACAGSTTRDRSTSPNAVQLGGGEAG